MTWLFVLVFAFLSGVFLYRKRYTSEMRVKGLYFIQFYYLFILTPIISLSLIQIGLEVMRRPEVINFPVESQVLFSMYLLSIIFCTIGSGIHATSTSVSQALRKYNYLQAFHINEGFHGALSHDMIIVGIVYAANFIMLLELNHPLSQANNYYLLSIVLGICIGIGGVITVIRGTHLGINIIASVISLFIEAVALFPLSYSLHYFPFATTAHIALITFVVGLLIATLIYLSSARLTKHLIRFCFPKGHPLRENFRMF